MARWRVAQKLALEWSPEQISGWLKRQFATTQGMQISHETIYRSQHHPFKTGFANLLQA
jgi:IS30 family transposase